MTICTIRSTYTQTHRLIHTNREKGHIWIETKLRDTLKKNTDRHAHTGIHRRIGIEMTIVFSSPEISPYIFVA